MKITIYILFVFFLLASCASKENIVYLQNNNSNSGSTEYEPIIQPDDVLSIIVSSENPEVAAPYNLKSVAVQNATEIIPVNDAFQAYIVDNNGAIQFPMLGSVVLGGLTKTEAVDKLKSILKDHVKDAIINMRILNFKVSVLGEVARPGTFNIKSERITLLEALSMAGDLTVYGKRKNIMVIRENKGVKTTQRIDLTNTDFLNSPYYYLAQNDVVYVEPNKTKVNSSVVGPNLTVAISAVSLLVTILAITIR
jgi:polysaccharide export outer membrane protein